MFWQLVLPKITTGEIQTLLPPPQHLTRTNRPNPGKDTLAPIAINDLVIVELEILIGERFMSEIIFATNAT